MKNIKPAHVLVCLLAPAGTPAAVIEKTNADLKRYGRIIREQGLKAE